jgi:hypothetical protein
VKKAKFLFDFPEVKRIFSYNSYEASKIILRANKNFRLSRAAAVRDICATPIAYRLRASAEILDKAAVWINLFLAFF